MKKRNAPYYKPRVYLSAKVRLPNHKRNNLVASYLRGQFDIFLPHEHQNGHDDHENIPISVFNMDTTAMLQSDLAVLVPPAGKDCCYEVGWLVAQNKPVFIYVDDDLSFLADAMVCGGVSAVFTANQESYLRLLQHPVLKSKTFKLAEPQYLGMEVMDFYNDIMDGDILMEDCE